ncbi:MAG TPA: DUF5818 domain-containing protein [Candidatus Sulfotelmatobacter sp.]|nr:DUF5818 domain-containing protein [Candidatus Sulfotelmatobacter sp.]
MNKKLQLLSLTASAAVLIAVLSWGGVAQAQQTSPNSDQSPSQTAPPPPQSQPPDASQQSPSSQQAPSQNPPAQPPDTQAPATRQGQADPGQTPDQAQGAANGTEFVGTVVKQGTKYMFQDAASGNTYDIDHQDEVKKFDGKKVRVRGTLDPQTKTIHVQ